MGSGADRLDLRWSSEGVSEPVPVSRHLLGWDRYYGAAMTEVARYRGGDVCIVGGANSAGQGALFFSRHARRVFLLVRGDSIRAGISQYLVDRVDATPNIEVVTGVQVAEVAGEGKLERVVLRSADDRDETSLEVAAMFIFIGTAPHTESVAGLVELDEKGYVLTGPDLPRENGRRRGWSLDRDPFLFETSVPGIFSAGDMRAGSGKRVAAAVGEGSGVVNMVHRYLESV